MRADTWVETNGALMLRCTGLRAAPACASHADRRRQAQASQQLPLQPTENLYKRVKLLDPFVKIREIRGRSGDNTFRRQLLSPSR